MQKANDRLLGVGLYAAAEASRLTRIPVRRIRRWLRGYAHRGGASAPLWTPEIPQFGLGLEVSFADLIELRFVEAFIGAGVRLPTIRQALVRAREEFALERPFATRRFRTDGRKIFMEIEEAAKDHALIDLNKNQYAFHNIVAPSFKGLEFDGDAVVRWRPWPARESIVVDPARAFGAPLLDRSGVPTRALFEAYKVSASFKVVANDFELPERAVRDAVAFEERLAA